MKTTWIILRNTHLSIGFNHSCLSFSIHDPTHLLTVLHTWENDISFCITIELSLIIHGEFQLTLFYKHL